MKFVVRRASVWGETKPCDEAVQEKIMRVDTRFFRSPDEYDNKRYVNTPKWLEEGMNHRITKKGFIQRDLGYKTVWIINLDSLDDLIAFQEKYCDVIIRDSYINPDYKEILIYDGYIE